MEKKKCYVPVRIVQHTINALVADGWGYSTEGIAKQEGEKRGEPFVVLSGELYEKYLDAVFTMIHITMSAGIEPLVVKKGDEK